MVDNNAPDHDQGETSLQEGLIRLNKMDTFRRKYGKSPLLGRNQIELERQHREAATKAAIDREAATKAAIDQLTDRYLAGDGLARGRQHPSAEVQLSLCKRCGAPARESLCQACQVHIFPPTGPVIQGSGFFDIREGHAGERDVAKVEAKIAELLPEYAPAIQDAWQHYQRPPSICDVCSLSGLAERTLKRRIRGVPWRQFRTRAYRFTNGENSSEVGPQWP
jgi:hypothetical protein